MNTSIRRIRRPVKRESVERYLRVTLVSFAATVILIRLFLELTGYPQVGSSELHIAHLLWGGLLLFVASLMLLLFANRWMYSAGALLAGVGIGLFIDEVGKFITQNNDYFFPAAAPIIYAFFLLTVLLYLRMRRPQPRSTRIELYHALEAFEEVLDHDLSAEERASLDARLDRVARQADHPDFARLASALREFLASDALYVATDSPGLWERCVQRVRGYGARWITPRRLKAALTGGLVVLGLGGLISLAVLVIVALAPTGAYLEAQLPSGGGADPSVVPLESLELGALVAFLARLALGGVAGLLLLAGAVFMIFGRDRWGSVLGYFGLLLSLTIVSLLDFYFDQFRAIVGAAIQFAVLIGIIIYRRRYLLPGPDKDRPLSGNQNEARDERSLGGSQP